VKIKRKINKIKVVFTVLIIIHTGVIFSANTGDIVITEYFYKTAGNIYEYIELYNTTDSTIDLQGWKIDIVDNQSPYIIDETFKIDSDSLGVLVSFVQEKLMVQKMNPILFSINAQVHVMLGGMIFIGCNFQSYQMNQEK